MAHKNKENWSPYRARRGEKKSLAGSKAPHLTSRRRKELPRLIPAPEAEERLRDIFINHQMAHITPREISLMVRYYQLLMQAQVHYNLTRLWQFRDIAIKHFIDCALVRDLTPLQFPLMDIGTGPGLPGIILKILFPQERIILAEGVQKKIDFLKRVRDELELPHLDIIGKYVTEDFEYPVPAVITRAVEDMRNTLKNTRNCLQKGGLAYFMKGPQVDYELKLVQEELGQQFTLISDIHYTLPKTPHQRRLVIYRKNAQ